MSEPKLNWAEAQVCDRRLTVPIEGEIPTGWKQSAELTLRLLGHGGWGEVDVHAKKATIEVREVSPGSEESLRIHLEGVVQEANAACHEEEDDGEDGEVEDPEVIASEEADEEATMTKRFRSFADG